MCVFVPQNDFFNSPIERTSYLAAIPVGEWAQVVEIDGHNETFVARRLKGLPSNPGGAVRTYGSDVCFSTMRTYCALCPGFPSLFRFEETDLYGYFHL